MKKVACIGNMNNMFFSLVRYLRDKGIDADLLLRNNEFDHFLPQADCFNQDYYSYTNNLSWGHVNKWYTTPAKNIAADLKKYDFLIGCGTAPAFLEKISRRLDLFMPYGADFYGFPFMKFPWFIPLYFHFSQAQKRGIKKSRYISLDLSNDSFEEPLKKIGPTGTRLYMTPPMLYLPEYSLDSIERYSFQYPFTQQFHSIRKAHFPIVFHQTRQNWKTSPDSFTWKGNDKLVRGFSDFVQQVKNNYNPALILLEYGSDVQETKDLITSLDLENNVYWFPQMTRKELMIGLSLSDIGTGEYANSWLSCGTVYESLAMGKPLLHYREDELYKNHYPELYPLMNVKTENDIVNALIDYISRPEYFQKIGVKGQNWLKKYAIEKPINKVIDLIDETGLSSDT